MATKQERVRLLAAARNNPVLQQVIMEKCRRDPVYWFNYFCWTYDPRPNKGRLLFNLYPFQEDFIRDIVRYIKNGEDFGVEKSRDMGVSWLILGMFLWFWLFHLDKNFKIGSKKEEDVDTHGEISTLFEKLRFYLKTLPKWMLPEGFRMDRHATYMKLINPANQNTIKGESSNPDFSRSGRYSAVLFDEFAFWPYGDSAWGAAGDSTPCRISVSTPYGKANRFGRQMVGRKLDERIQNKIRLHWSLHPLKDDAWYEEQKKRRTKNEVARELDISYELSVEGIVFPELKPELHIVQGAYTFEPDRKNLAAFDFGFLANAGLICQIDENDTLHVAKEIVLKNTNTEDLGTAFQNFIKDKDLERGWTYTCDPSGKARKGAEKEESTHHQVLESMGIWPLDFEKAQKMPNRLDDGIQLIKSVLSGRYLGYERIQIYEDGCPTLIEAFQSEYRYKTDANGDLTDTIHEEHPWEDVMDCFRYAVIQVFSVQTKKEVRRAATAIGRRNPYTGYRA